MKYISVFWDSSVVSHTTLLNLKSVLVLLKRSTTSQLEMLNHSNSALMQINLSSLKYHCRTNMFSVVPLVFWGTRHLDSYQSKCGVGLSVNLDLLSKTVSSNDSCNEKTAVEPSFKRSWMQ